MVLMPGFQSTRLVTEGALEPFFFLYTDDSIQGNPETCKQSSIMLNYEVKNNKVKAVLFVRWRRALRNRHTGGGCKTLIGAPGKSRGTERIRKGEKKKSSVVCRRAERK